MMGDSSYTYMEQNDLNLKFFIKIPSIFDIIVKMLSAFSW